MRKNLLPLLIVLLCGDLTWAHLNSFSFSTIEIKEDAIHMELRLTLICTLELFPVDTDANQFLSEEELKAFRSMMYYYLTNKLKILNSGRQLHLVLKDISFHVEEDDSYTVFNLVIPLRKPLENVIILCNVLEETDPYHRNLSEIKMKGNEYLFIFTNDNYFDSSKPPPANSGKAGLIPSATP
ncbi:MAG: hypothetical protein C4527_14555 [Candidatus Omnitrophota bacterium]|jgi:hypothetical protein|nr:MAG: hypothetical protein C4527_14555 [Candidatus Omnitrophota bacterium]